MPVLTATRVDETHLYGLLVAAGAARDAGGLAGQVRALCHEAAARLKQFPGLHAQFTLHDEVHCLRVVDLMGRLLGPVADRLNEVELALLILAAYFHDQGMVADGEDLDALRASSDWRDHSAVWSAEHPNLGELMQRLADPLLGEPERTEAVRAAADLDAAMFTDFIRIRHGERSAQFVMTRYGDDPRLRYQERHLGRLLAALCQSHVLPTSELTAAGGLRIDELVGAARVNMVLLAYVLRLADICDFDRDRTPDPLYRAITFSSRVSLLEWEKHRSIVGWEISPERIAYSAECSHPAYERAIRQFVEWIDGELADAREWTRTLPQSLDAHRLQLPASVDASHVGARVDPISRRPEYIYRDLEFTLARDELVKLLMTDNLYDGRGLFVRELLQNALDALRHRSALYGLSGSEPPVLEVALEHVKDSGDFDVVRCRDNGVGMDLSVVTKFLTRAGRSFYRSPEFERERARFQLAGCDFDPCARFGIGFMSCFMFGDEITILTRRDYGVGQAWGEPLVVQITGLSGIIAIRPGAADQPVGTTVEVRSRRRSFIVDEWDDPVRLVRVVRGYAIATEFPISAVCGVPGIASRAEVPPTFEAPLHPLERSDVRGKHVFRIDLRGADARLRGEFRLCTLVDGAGLVTVENEEARVCWKPDDSPDVGRGRHVVESANGALVPLEHHVDASQVGADGILVAGHPGRGGGDDLRLGMHSSPVRFSGASYLIDSRGSIKPALTPARTPPRWAFRRDQTWTRLERAAGTAYGQLLEAVLDRCTPEQHPERFWAAVAAYSLDVAYLPLDTFWHRVRLPVLMADGVSEWRALWELGPVRLRFRERAGSEPLLGDGSVASRWELELAGGAVLGVPPTVANHEIGRPAPSREESWLLRHLVIACSVAEVVSPHELRLTPSAPGRQFLRNLIIGETPSLLYALRFTETHNGIVRVAAGSPFVNVGHPVVAHAREALDADRDELPPLEQFLRTLLWAWPPFRSTDAVPTDSWYARNREKLGELFAAIDWGPVGTALRPPYRAFVPGLGVVELTAADLHAWRWGTQSRGAGFASR